MLRALRDSPDAEFVYADLTALYESNGQTEARKLPRIGWRSQRTTITWIRVWKRFPMRHLARDLYLYRFHSRSLTSSTKLMEAYVVSVVVMYRHGFMTFAELTDSIYRQVSKVRNDYPVSDAVDADDPLAVRGAYQGVWPGALRPRLTWTEPTTLA
jgi:hypothetical protein